VLSSDAGDLEYTSIGLMVESRPSKRIILQLGTIGYQGEGLSNNNPWGIRAGVGTDYSFSKCCKLVGLLRSDRIFDEEETVIYSLQVGVQIRVWERD
jgi:hypothetical protein